MTPGFRPYIRHVCAAHQRGTRCCPAHGRACPLTSVHAVEPGSAEGARLADQARITLAHSPTLWVQTAHAAYPVGRHGATAEGSVAMALCADNPLVGDVNRQRREVPAVVAAAELGPAGPPDRVRSRAWLSGWLRETHPFEFEDLTRVITATVRGPQVTRRPRDLRLLVFDVTEVLVPEGVGAETIFSIDLTDYALA